MARITICDRCGKSTKDDWEHSIFSRYRCKWERIDVDYASDSEKRYYLCGDCSKLLKKFLDEKPKEK